MVGLLAEEIRKVVALQAAGAPALVSSLGVRYSLPPEVEMFTDREENSIASWPQRRRTQTAVT